MQEIKETEEYVEEEDFEVIKESNFKAKLEAFLIGKYFVPLVIILVAVISFSLGRISGLQDKKAPVRIISGDGEVKGASDNSSPNPLPLQQGKGAVEQSDSVMNSATDSGSVVASKNGTKYHYPWCAGAKQISTKNLITFDSIEEARKAGYTPASNCKGLK